jgi:hypothetical protein
MKHLELAFRQELKKVMNGLWLMTWHEDGLVNPGVPDVSYVMNPGMSETGWLELKAIEGADKNGNYKFTLEPSQHRWINDHFSRVPVHILCATDTVCWLVPGLAHRLLINPLNHQQLGQIGIGMQREQLRHILHSELTAATDRRRCGLFGV